MEMIETRKYGKEKIILLCGVCLVMTGLGMTLQVLPFYIEKTLKAKIMMDNHGSYYYWGMHMGWWVLIVVIVIAIFGFTRFRRRK